MHQERWVCALGEPRSLRFSDPCAYLLRERHAVTVVEWASISSQYRDHRRARLRIQMKAGVESVPWIIVVQLVLVAAFVAFLLYDALPVPGAKLGGGFYLLIGVLNVLFHKSTGRKLFARAQSSWPFVAKFWARIGEKGTELLFLGFSVILAIAGTILLIAGKA
jgi:hypothetical protein